MSDYIYNSLPKGVTVVMIVADLEGDDVLSCYGQPATMI